MQDNGKTTTKQPPPDYTWDRETLDGASVCVIRRCGRYFAVTPNTDDAEQIVAALLAETARKDSDPLAVWLFGQ